MPFGRDLLNKFVKQGIVERKYWSGLKLRLLTVILRHNSNLPSWHFGAFCIPEIRKILQSLSGQWQQFLTSLAKNGRLIGWLLIVNFSFSVPKFTVDISEPAIKILEEILLFNPEDRLKLRQITEKRHLWYLTKINRKTQNQPNRNTDCDDRPVISRVVHHRYKSRLRPESGFFPVQIFVWYQTSLWTESGQI